MINETPKNDISLVLLIRVLWRAKFGIIAFSFVMAIISIFIALALPNQYESKAKLIANTEGVAGISSLAGGLGGLAGLAGINIGSGGDSVNPFIAKELISSYSFILSFIEEHSLLVPIMAAKKWDENSDQLLLDEDIYDSKRKLWFPGTKKEGQLPRKEDILARFKEIFSYSEDTKTGFISFSAEFYSPKLSQQWLTLIIASVNKSIREKDTAEASKNIEYLLNLVDESNNSAFNSAFAALIEEQTKKLMLGKAREDYVFKIIDPPYLPEKKSKPSRALICLGITFSGFFLAVGVVLIRYFVGHSLLDAKGELS